MNQTAEIPAHALHGHKSSGLNEDVTYNLPADAHHYVGANKYDEWKIAAEAAGAKLEWREVWGVWTCFATVDGRDVGRFKPGYCAHGHLLANAAGECPAAPLATIRRHAASHAALAGSDAYSAQEAPRLQAAANAATELAEAAKAYRSAVGAIGRYKAPGTPDFDSSIYVELLDKRDAAARRLDDAVEALEGVR
ncbi:MAG TPA: hypothetical protein VFE72_04020 [Lysobacter sp.]|nr:hypothetical protein [Lysobacter sp.]